MHRQGSNGAGWRRNSALGRQGVSRLPMHVEVANHVRELIVKGKMRQGERINENDLADFLGVSRTPLRDALKALQSEGLIVIEPHKGTFVSFITPDHTEKLFSALAGIERIGGEAATRTASDEERAWLREIHEEMYELHHHNRRSEYSDLNEQIHRAYVTLSGNDILSGFHERLIVGARRVRFAAIRLPERWDESVAEHKAILATMEAGEAEEAGKLIEQHVRRTGQVILEHLQYSNAQQPRPRRRGSYDRLRTPAG